jgi:hypothetical protein
MRSTRLLGALLAAVSLVLAGSGAAYADSTNTVVAPSSFGYSDSDNVNWTLVDQTQQPGETLHAPQLWVGRDPIAGRIFRGFLSFDLSSLAGKQIQSAALTVVLDHSFPCAAGGDSGLFAYRTSVTPPPPGGRLPWSPFIPGGVLLDQQVPPSANESSCPHPNVVISIAGNLAADLQAAVDSGATTYTVALSAASDASGTGESTQVRWKRINVFGAQLNVTYA